MKNLTKSVLATALAAAMPLTLHAQTSQPAAPGATAAAALPMAEGEVRKVDLDNKKLTLRHGEIKNLDMPGMTMVFQVKDPAMLGKVKAGDKDRFSAEKIDGAFTVTSIEAAK
ncbi:MAG: copper-binding protein [Hyphomicrobium sp.]|nr:copper-binding protein [Hyphomicrobium sp.]